MLFYAITLSLAGHCSLSNLILARLGAYDITQPADGFNVVDTKIVNQYVHELYNAKSIAYDISVLKLDRILPITSYVRPICIPFSDDLRFKDFTNTHPWVVSCYFFVVSAVLSIFSLPSNLRLDGVQRVSEVLHHLYYRFLFNYKFNLNYINNCIFKEVQLPVIPTQECAFNYKLYFPNQIFDDKVLCAGYSEGIKENILSFELYLNKSILYYALSCHHHDSI
jgi:serine protease 56